MQLSLNKAVASRAAAFVIAICFWLNADAQTAEAIKITSGNAYGNFDGLFAYHHLKLGKGWDPSKAYGDMYFVVKTRVKPAFPQNGTESYDKDDVVTFRVINGVVTLSGTPVNPLNGYPQGGKIASYSPGTDLWEYSSDGRLYDFNTHVVIGSTTPISARFVVYGIFSDVNITRKVDLNMTTTINLARFCGAVCPRCKAGTVDIHTGGIAVNMKLGYDLHEDFQNSLAIQSSLPHQHLATPFALIPQMSTNSDVVTNLAGVRQVKDATMLADIVVSNAQQYKIDLYTTNNVLSKGTNGLYGVTNSPFKSVIIENPDGSSASNRLHVSEVENGITNSTKYSWDGTNTWTIEPFGGLRKETLSRVWDANRTNRTELHSILETNGTAVFQEQKLYRVFAWGEELIEQVIDPNGAKLTNTWQYYTTSADTNQYTLLKERAWPNGHWERYEYDSSFRETNRTQAFLNATNGAPASQCRQTVTIYSNANPRVIVIEKLLGQEIGRRYIKYNTNEEQVIQTRTPGASIAASDNLVTITKTYPEGDAFQGELKSVKHADDTMTFYQYAITNGQRTATMNTGATNSIGTGVEEGTSTATTVGAFKENISQTVSNITSGLLDILLSREIYSYPAGDSFKLSPRVSFLDGTSNQVNYGCCHVENVVGRDGSVTTYGYDASKRQTTVTHAGITHSNVYDAAGNILKVIRIGTNGTQIVLEQHAYDTAGHRIATTNAVGDVSLFAEAAGAGGSTNITTRLTNAGSGPARIEVRHRDGTLKSITGGLTYPVRYEYGPTNGGSFRKEIRLDASGDDTSEWDIQFSDAAGHPYKILYADGAFSQTFYNTKGQATNEVDADGVSRITLYNAKGEPSFIVIDMDRDGVVDWGGTDRITWTTNYVVNNGSADVHRTEIRVWATNGSDNSTLISTADSAVNGLTSWRTSFGVTTRSDNVFSGGGARWSTNTAPDGTVTISQFTDGRALFVRRTNHTGIALSHTTFAYDEHGRQTLVTDARNGSTTNTFDNLDRVVCISSPTPDSVTSAQVVRYGFNKLGHITAITNADSTVLNREYFDSGELKKVYGSRTYPVEYTYDAQGRMRSMKTWQDFGNNSGTAITEWRYNERGSITNKLYADGPGPRYSYTSAGRLYQRIWARGIITTYTTNAAGEVASIDYSDSTPDVTYTYDRLGRRTSIVDGAGTHVFTFNLDGSLVLETNTAGVLSGLAITNGYDAFHRRFALSLVGDVNTFVNYGYDAASRLIGVTNGANTATYSYLANSPLVEQITFKNSGATRMTSAKSYDFLNRLLAVTNLPSSDSPVIFNYANNAANQRTSNTNADGSRWVYTYDTLGQVTSGRKYWSDGTPVLGQEFEYTFDDIGNRKTAVSGGDELGRGKRTQMYTANNLNQYTQRTVPGYLDIIGTATNSATVTVNSGPTSRKNDYYHGEIVVANSANAVWQSITNAAVDAFGTNDMVTNTVGKLFVPQNPEIFSYDADGNLTNDGRWRLTWDAENRLIQMASLPGAPVGCSNRLGFAYDALGRRVSKVTEAFTDGAWIIGLSNRFIYDGWKLLVDLNATNNSVVNSLTWGSDLSGTPQEAGGVGGLLFCRTYDSPSPGTLFYGYDGSANVSMLVNASDGVIAAAYDYSPYGSPILSRGPAATANLVLFSTKFYDRETDLLYYGFRYYNHLTGRWMSRDPIGERGGHNLLSFVDNNPIVYCDALGFNIYTKRQEANIAVIQAQTTVPGVGGLTYPSKTTFEGEDIIDEVDNELACRGCFCAEVIKAKDMHVTIVSLTPNDGLGTHYTMIGLAAIQGHEQRRVSIWVTSYEVYMDPSRVEGVYTKRCNRVCSQTQGAAKAALATYLEQLRAKAEPTFRLSAIKFLNELGAFERSRRIFVNGLFDGYSQTYPTPPSDWPKLELPPCPKSNCSSN